MARRFEEFYKAEKGTLTAEFQKQNPDYFSALQSRPEDLRRVVKILEHTEETVKAHELEQKEIHQMRVGEEAVRIFEERAEHLGLVADEVKADIISSPSLLEEARKRITELEKSEIQDIRKNGETAAKVISEMAISHQKGHMMSEEEMKHFKAELHEAVDTAQKARTQASKIFYNERENLIEQAKAAGSQEPEKDVGSAQAEIKRNIDKQEHKDIHAVFEKYGWERGKKAVEFKDGPEPVKDEHAREELVNHVQNYVEKNLNQDIKTESQDESQTIETSHEEDVTPGH
jgi:hypothetical protein